MYGGQLAKQDLPLPLMELSSYKMQESGDVVLALFVLAFYGRGSVVPGLRQE